MAKKQRGQAAPELDARPAGQAEQPSEQQAAEPTSEASPPAEQASAEEQAASESPEASEAESSEASETAEAPAAPAVSKSVGPAKVELAAEMPAPLRSRRPMRSRDERLEELFELAAVQARSENLSMDDFVAKQVAKHLGREDLVLSDLSHEPSGELCTLVNHNDGDPRPCEICRHCKHKLRPRQLPQPCPARVV